MTPAQKDRYSRHINLSDIGESGQQKLLDSTALIVGLGGLGSPVAMYLTAAGVGRLIFADFDVVEMSNLQRQIAHTSDRTGVLKSHSAMQTCKAINPDIQIETIDEVLDRDSLEKLVPQCDVVLEGSDNFPTRFAVNEACVRHAVPLVSGAAIRFDGQVSVFAGHKPDSPCYRCLYTEGSDTAETCAQTGVLAPVVGYDWNRAGGRSHQGTCRLWSQPGRQAAIAGRSVYGVARNRFTQAPRLPGMFGN